MKIIWYVVTEMFQNHIIQEIVKFAFVRIHMSGIYIISAPRNNPSYTHRIIVIKIQRKKLTILKTAKFAA